MHFCYLDESGCTGTLPSPASAIQPVFVIAGLIIDQHTLADLTHDFILFKQKYYPALTKSCSSYLECILAEIKGSEIRKAARESNRNKRRYAFGVIDAALKILEKHHVKVVGRIWIKEPGVAFNGRSVYTSSVQSICYSFQNFLTESGSPGGIVIGDSRTKALNSIVSHSIFTQKFKGSGDNFNKIHEMPLFGHSDNHAGIQLADIVCSAILFPIASSVYCTGHITDHTHVHPRHTSIRDTFGKRLERLQYRHHDGVKWRGGIVMSDPLERRNAAQMFTAPAAPAAPAGV